MQMADREKRLAGLIHYVGQRPIRAGRVALAVICWRTDFEAYANLGRPVTGRTPEEACRYVVAREPGEMPPPRSLWAALRDGWRWGAVGHELETGRLSRASARWVAEQWRGGVPV